MTEHSEARFSLTTKLVDAQGLEWLVTIRDGADLEAARDAWAVASQITAGLIKAGATPAGANGHAPSNGNSHNGTAPLCPTHGTPMKRSQHGSGWYCSTKIAEDDGTGKPVYCKQRVQQT